MPNLSQTQSLLVVETYLSWILENPLHLSGTPNKLANVLTAGLLSTYQNQNLHNIFLVYADSVVLFYT